MEDKLSRPPIGNYRSVPGNVPRGSMMPTEPLPEPKAEAKVETKEEVESTPKIEEPEVPKTTVELYQERLANAKITMAEAQTIIDAVLQKDYYEEFFEIRGQKGVLRTRSYEDLLRLQAAVETFKPSTQMSQDELMGRYNLAGSLSEWRTQKFKHETDADFQANLDRIKKFPGPIMALMIDQLAKFDAKVMIVFSEGATDSF